MGKKAARQEISEVRIGVSAENIDENGVDQVQWNKTKKQLTKNPSYKAKKQARNGMQKRLPKQ